MELALKSGLDICDGAMLASLILATDHFQQGAIDHPLKHILLGADLTILGENSDIYNAYALAIGRHISHFLQNCSIRTVKTL